MSSQTTYQQLLDASANFNIPYVFQIPYTSPVAPDKNNIVGVAVKNMLIGTSFSGKSYRLTDNTGWKENSNSATIGTEYNGYSISFQNAAKAWINNAGIVLSPGKYIINVALTTSGGQAGKMFTIRLASDTVSDYGPRQSVYCLQGDMYSANLSWVLSFNDTTTLYLQSWANDTINYTATRIQAIRIN